MLFAESFILDGCVVSEYAPGSIISKETQE